MGRRSYRGDIQIEASEVACEEAGDIAGNCGHMDMTEQVLRDSGFNFITIDSGRYEL